ncbi:hypothetical protein EDD21DRAFT_417111 [Dissophora ornata]|nr:hypothetical protein EDD21DRAFT_417111 [Dissophora ornata]
MDTSPDHMPETGSSSTTASLDLNDSQDPAMQESIANAALDAADGPPSSAAATFRSTPAALPQPQQAQQQSRRRHPPASIPGLPYPHQRTQSLTSRQPRVQQSSVIRHARNHTYSDTIPPHYSSLMTRIRAEDTNPPELDIPGATTSSGSISTSTTPSPDQQLVTRYLRQFLQGCGVTPCPTPLCASNPDFPLKHANEIAVKAVEIASKGTGEICPRLETWSASSGQQREIVADSSVDLDIVSFKALIEQCKHEQSYDALLKRLQTVFSSLSRLSMSFADVSYSHDKDAFFGNIQLVTSY